MTTRKNNIAAIVRYDDETAQYSITKMENQYQIFTVYANSPLDCYLMVQSIIGKGKAKRVGVDSNTHARLAELCRYVTVSFDRWLIV